MGRRLGYDFDKVDLRKQVYSPQGHFNDELESRQFRQMTLQLLGGKRGLPKISTVIPPDLEAGKKFEPSILNVLEGRRAVAVKVEKTANN
jgi:hypothetical protein